MSLPRRLVDIPRKIVSLLIKLIAKANALDYAWFSLIFQPAEHDVCTEVAPEYWFRSSDCLDRSDICSYNSLASVSSLREPRSTRPWSLRAIKHFQSRAFRNSLLRDAKIYSAFSFFQRDKRVARLKRSRSNVPPSNAQRFDNAETRKVAGEFPIVGKFATRCRPRERSNLSVNAGSNFVAIITEGRDYERGKNERPGSNRCLP